MNNFNSDRWQVFEDNQFHQMLLVAELSVLCPLEIDLDLPSRPHPLGIKSVVDDKLSLFVRYQGLNYFWNIDWNWLLYLECQMY